MTERSAQQDELAWRMTGSRQEITDVLAEFARELRAGDVNVWKGQRELHLDPHGKLELRVRAFAHDDGRQELELRLSWTATSAAADLHGGANMGIAPGHPETGLRNL